MKRKDLFPTPVWTIDNCGVTDRDKMIEFCHHVKAEDPDGRKSSNLGGWQSWDFRPEVLKQNAFKPLYDIIMRWCYAAADDMGFQEYTLRMTNLWININKRGDYNVIHTHPGAVLSGVYYLSLPNCCSGDITFQRDPKEQHLREFWGCSDNFDRWNEVIADEYDMYPEEDKLIIFPAHLPHRVNQSASDGDRISISFNVTAFSNYYHEIYPTNQPNRTKLSL
tara:strand:- start:10123 stop:10788 length:666 start_codon:yes stop_codon:yes gene_type:complete